MHTFKINAPLKVEDTFIEMDGKRIEGVEEVSFVIREDCPTVVIIHIQGIVIVDGEFRHDDMRVVSKRDAAA